MDICVIWSLLSASDNAHYSIKSANSYKVKNIRFDWVHSSAWIEWLPAEQSVEGSSPPGPVLNGTFR